MMSTPELVDSVNALILTDSRVTIKGNSEQHKISIGIAHKNCVCLPRLLKVQFSLGFIWIMWHLIWRQERKKPLVRLVGDSCRILLSDHLQIFIKIVPWKNFYIDQCFHVGINCRELWTKWLKTLLKCFYPERTQKFVFWWKKSLRKNGHWIKE